MPKLSIITINRNNAAGLRKTLESVAQQVMPPFEHIIIDGASTDGSASYIATYAEQARERGIQVSWLSEPDNGIYNAMNKGIRMAQGEFCQFLNSGDCLADDAVVEQMTGELMRINNSLRQSGEAEIDVLYGDMQKVYADGRTLLDRGNGTNEVTLRMFYRGCLNHSPAYIRRSLFDRYGYYDESLRICSDWKFYMQSIVLGTARVRYANLLVTVFDMGGISETRKDILNSERNRLLEELVPQGILADYKRYYEVMGVADRLRRHHLWKPVRFVERVLFKLEKWRIIK